MKVSLYGERDEIKDFVKKQEALERIQSLKDFIAVIEILKVNLLEHKDKKVYGEMTVFEVAEKVFGGLTH